METKKYKIQKIQQRLDEIDEQINYLMDEISEQINYLEDSKLMHNRFKVSELKKEWRKLQDDYFALKNIDL